jgi:hypothetical protein
MDRGGESRSGNILRLFSILGSRDEILRWLVRSPTGLRQAAGSAAERRLDDAAKLVADTQRGQWHDGCMVRYVELVR